MKEQNHKFGTWSASATLKCKRDGKKSVNSRRAGRLEPALGSAGGDENQTGKTVSRADAPPRRRPGAISGRGAAADCRARPGSGILIDRRHA